MALSTDRAGDVRPPPLAAPPALPGEGLPGEGLPGEGADVSASPATRLRKSSSQSRKTTARTKLPPVLPPDEDADPAHEPAALAILKAPGDPPEPRSQPETRLSPPAVALLFDASAEPEPQPPTLPAAPSPPAPPARGRPVRQGLWVVLLLVLLLAGAVAYLLTAYRHHDPSDKPPFRIAGWSAWLPDGWKNKPGSAQAGTPTAQPAQASTHPLRRAQTAIQAVQAVRRETPLIQPAPSQAPPPAASNPAPSEAPLSAAPPVTSPAQSDAAAQAPVADVVVWPEVTLTATVGRGTRGSALINGILLTVGEATNEGLLLEKIEPRAAIVSYRGETRRFVVGKR